MARVCASVIRRGVGTRLAVVASIIGGMSVAATAAPVTARGGEVPLLTEPPASCATPEACVFDIDVDVPDGAVVPGSDERPGNRVRVILPPGHDESGERPLLLLLHGAGDGSESWTDMTDVEQFVAELCTADSEACPVVVMPDGGGKHSETGWYTDWHDGSRQWETFHIEGVIPWARDSLGVGACRDSTLVAGLSMGGFGAFSYAGRHPDLFVGAASFSGFLDTRPAPPLSTIGFQLAQDNGLGAPTEDAFGPAGPPTEQDGWSEHNPTDLARAGAYDAFNGNLWLAVGTGTPGGPAGDEPDNPGSYAVESFIFELTQSFRVAMIVAGSGFNDQSYIGGNHAWPYWQMALRNALPEMLAVTSPCSGRAGAGAPAVASPPTASPSPATLAARGSIPATGVAIPLGLAMVAIVFGLTLSKARRPARPSSSDQLGSSRARQLVLPNRSTGHGQQKRFG